MMIIDIDDKARERIKKWDKDISDSFSLIFCLISDNFFDCRENVNVANYEENKLMVKGLNSGNSCYISYDSASDIFENRIMINDDNKCFGYEVNKSNSGINLNLNMITKKINSNIIEIYMLGYGVSVRVYMPSYVLINEIRGKDLKFDYNKLLSVYDITSCGLDFIMDCVSSGEIIDAIVSKYKNRELRPYELVSYNVEKNKTLVRK